MEFEKKLNVLFVITITAELLTDKEKVPKDMQEIRYVKNRCEHFHFYLLS